MQNLISTMGDKVAASEDIERHVVRKFEICQRLGKGVSSAEFISVFTALYSHFAWRISLTLLLLLHLVSLRLTV